MIRLTRAVSQSPSLKERAITLWRSRSASAWSASLAALTAGFAMLAGALLSTAIALFLAMKRTSAERDQQT